MHADVCILNISLNFCSNCAYVLTLKLKGDNCFLQYLLTVNTDVRVTFHFIVKVKSSLSQVIHL